jgi:hypothetical protein
MRDSLRILMERDMRRDFSQGAVREASQRATLLSSIDVPLFAAIAAMPAVLLAGNLPAELLLPGIAALAFMLATFAAFAGLITRTPRDAATVTIWDMAGACVLIGIVAGAFSEAVQISQLFGIAIAAP